MRLSRNAHYAMRTVLDLSQRGRGRSAEIASRQGIPAAYMAKVVQGLGRAGILRTYRGTNGGVQLARTAAAITLRDVVEATEGPVAINLCAAWGDCPCLQPCPIRATLARVEGLLERELAAVTIADLAGKVPVRARGSGHRERAAGP